MNLERYFIRTGICIAVVQILFGSQLLVTADANENSILLSAGNHQILSGAAITLGGAITGLDVAHTSTSTSEVSDLRGAISTLSGMDGSPVVADLGGKTYLPGTYAALGGTAFSMTSGIILDGNNDCNSKFIFVTPAAMNTTAGISITLINNAQASNVYWVSGAAITIGASNNIAGNFLSPAAITVGASTSINGRFLAVQAVTVGASAVFQGFPLAGCSPPRGGLSISVPESLKIRNLDPGETISVEMDQVIVTDTRGASMPATWTVSTISTSMNNEAGDSIGANLFSYSLKGLTSTGGLAFITHALNSMLTSTPILVATDGAGINSATWIPVISISVPLDQVEGRYTGSITHSVY